MTNRGPLCTTQLPEPGLPVLLEIKMVRNPTIFAVAGLDSVHSRIGYGPDTSNIYL